jgi:hypothetical protein
VEFHIEQWRDLYVMLGTSSAALLGLLYVVASLHLVELTRNTVYRTRAHSNTLYLIITIVEAVCVLAPQPPLALGIEFIAVNLIGMAINLKNTIRFTANAERRRRGGFSFNRVIAFQSSFLLGIAAGVCLMKGLTVGLYLATASYVLLFIITALNAWAIMLGVGEADATKKLDQEAGD